MTKIFVSWKNNEFRQNLTRVRRYTIVQKGDLCLNYLGSEYLKEFKTRDRLEVVGKWSKKKGERKGRDIKRYGTHDVVEKEREREREDIPDEYREEIMRKIKAELGSDIIISDMRVVSESNVEPRHKISKYHRKGSEDDYDPRYRIEILEEKDVDCVDCDAEEFIALKVIISQGHTLSEAQKRIAFFEHFLKTCLRSIATAEMDMVERNPRYRDTKIFVIYKSDRGEYTGKEYVETLGYWIDDVTK